MIPGIYKSYVSCKLCPRRCGVNRLEGEKGFCGESAELRIASASIHRGEEPPVTGRGGSGTVFITGCTLGCSFCQNWQISQAGMGRAADTEEFAQICLALQNAGAENINIVTGSHSVPAIAAGIAGAKETGLSIPVLWNSSGYESLEALSLLENTADVYLPDLKTLDSGIAGRFFKAPDYPAAASAAVIRMMETQPLRFKTAGAEHGDGDRAQIIRSGVIIRHLVLPGYLEATRQVLRWFAENGQGRALLSLMTQYTPVHPEGTAADRKTGAGASGDRAHAPERYMEQKEYEAVLDMLDEYGIEDGFYQELVQDSAWLPDFRRVNPFSSELSLPVWHWEKGFAGRP
ncbi:radical SAM protein [Treponema sp. OttesenSCG-928-L16]|nr:radical SAM protein [Treponema sp. OttesenSCG-928-L16]